MFSLTSILSIKFFHFLRCSNGSQIAVSVAKSVVLWMLSGWEDVPTRNVQFLFLLESTEMANISNKWITDIKHPVGTGFDSVFR